MQCDGYFDEDELLRLPKVEAICGLKRSQIYADIKEGVFPPPAKLGGASRWSRREIQAWIANRLKAREGGVRGSRRHAEVTSHNEHATA